MKKSLLVCSAAFVLNHAAFADTDLTDQTLTQPTGTVETTENKSEEHSVQRSVVMEKVQMLEESSEQFFAYISECASFLPENYPRLQELNKELNKDAELRERVEKKLANGEEPEGEEELKTAELLKELKPLMEKVNGLQEKYSSGGDLMTDARVEIMETVAAELESLLAETPDDEELSQALETVKNDKEKAVSMLKTISG